MTYDVVIIGGGPAGLAAALTLGRARKRVLVCDAGPRRNAATAQIHNFVTRDGTPPDMFREVGQDQLKTYPRVRVATSRVKSISGDRGSFQVQSTTETVTARRILLCTGMVDEVLAIEGFDTFWGHSVYACPYCHGWEIQDSPWGFLPSAEHPEMLLHFALMARGWTRDLVVLTNAAIAVPDETRASLQTAGIRLETQAIARLVGQETRLNAVELVDGTSVACEALFTHPPQRQVGLVAGLGVALDKDGYVAVDAMRRETSIPGIYAAGDLTTRMQSAIFAAAMGTQAAAMMNMELTAELALAGELG